MDTQASGWVVPTLVGDVHGYDAGPYGHSVQATDHPARIHDLADVTGQDSPAAAAEAALDGVR